MRSPNDVDFIRDRVLADIAANPSIRPYLGEEDRPKRGRKPETDRTEYRRRWREKNRAQQAEYKRRWRARRAP